MALVHRRPELSRHPVVVTDRGGVHTLDYPQRVVDEALMTRCRAARDAMPPHILYSHVTAARLLGLPLPYAVEDDDRLHVMRPSTEPQTRVEGLVGHRFHHPRGITEVHGLRVTDLADTWVDLGDLVGRGKPMGLDDLIVVGDACATRLRAVSPLRVALGRRVRPRGKRTLVEALRLIRVGSISPMETVARIMFVRAGLPEPAPNQPVFASEGSGRRLLGFGDLVWHIERRGQPPIKVIGEYQGEEFHSSEEHRDHDRVRREEFEDDGWTVQEIWRSDLTGARARRELVEKLAWFLEIPSPVLRLADIEPRFFSEYAMELAIQRGMRR